ncbi:hypothetical protein K437DRAFT_31731 [Tilletiaria anomala UBC 951]|uniref:Oxysterol-binding protein n=1 Tax=Tilletiaria anomala (strain ATCC 24038 / CBS 436.72 / UBC 951) TaxID=1037660 RepID=A0A066VH92_TILAU|nr:uncharacterized protein K437DRAFT_31731 [Tilletiaria anomala UBC 951]KDN37930.1 hypothetical protein K437DRAFT_31731 [Tilletiaria anomala UBC 951]
MSTRSTAPAPATTSADADATHEDIAAPLQTLDSLEAHEAAVAKAADGEALAAEGAAGAGGEEESHSESGKLKVLIGLLKRVVGVKDLAAIRFSLPATLLEPVPNLEYWTYLDRADMIASIPDFDDPLDRMLMVLRFALTKELKFVKGKVCKPYNSVLGEHFRCHWNAETPAVTAAGDILPVQALEPGVDAPSPLPLASKGGRASKAASLSSRPGSIKEAAASAEAEEKSTLARSQPTKRGLSKFLSGRNVGGSGAGGSAAAATSANLEPAANGSATNVSSTTLFATSIIAPSQKRRIAFLTEQVSHHPPISTFYCECAEAGVHVRGVDQLSAKFTGASVRVYPGDQNKGLFIGLTDTASGAGAPGEEYQLTHPTASINGFFRGNIWVAISDHTYITCRGGSRPDDDDDDDNDNNDNNRGAGGTGKSKGKRKRLRTIIEYKEESWVMKAKYALEGVIYEYDYDPDDGHDDEEQEQTEDGDSDSDGKQKRHYTKIKQVPQDKVVATFEGQWRGDVTYKLKGERESRLLIRLDELALTRKTVRPLDAHEEMESRRIWKPVTDAIIGKQFSAATKHKQEIEQAQREAAAERKRRGEAFVPQFFHVDFGDGRPRLTDAGRKALRDEAALVGYGPAAGSGEHAAKD